MSQSMSHTYISLVFVNFLERKGALITDCTCIRCSYVYMLVNGNWTRWSAWQPCTVTCGDGYQERYRYCSEPAPANGGLPCPGTDTDRRQCNRDKCPGKMTVSSLNGVILDLR